RHPPTLHTHSILFLLDPLPGHPDLHSFPTRRSSDLEVPIRSEFTRLRYATGTAGMASAGKDTEGVQYFVTHSPQPHLDGRYTAFGRVVVGQDVADRLEQGDRVLRAVVTPTDERRPTGD